MTRRDTRNPFADGTEAVPPAWRAGHRPGRTRQGLGANLRTLAFCLMCACLPTLAAPVAVVQGYDAVAAGERRFAASLARHVERWYREAGVDAALADDRDLKTALVGKKVAVLVYLSQPTVRQLDELTAFSRRGGKLIVCYSSSPGLAALMGVQTVGYQKGSTDGRWSSMRFEEARPHGVPETIRQTSQNLFLVRPVEGVSRVLAWWMDRQGRETGYPAWLVSPAGYWMTHVLLADGDAEAKGRLLLALAAAHDPSLWGPASRRVFQQAGLIGGGLESILLRAGKVPAVERRCLAERLAQGALKSQRQVSGLLGAGRHFEAWQAANDFRARMFEAYGALQPTRKGEIRAVWDHSGQGLYPGEWERTCRLLKNAGISDLYVNVAGAGFAHYASKVLPRSRVFQEQGDQLAACVKAAKAVGLRVHAWILCFSTEGATAERNEIFRQRRWLLTNEDGSPRPWLDPAVPAVRDYLVQAVRELCADYRTDGVHLDFVRYPDFASSLGPGVKARFEQATGRRSADWPEDVKSGALRAMFIRWRAEQVSDFVQASRRVMRRDAPGKMLTAAVFGKYPSCLDAVGQDWESWVNIGLVDYVAPMNYTESLARFNEWLSQQSRSRRQALRVLPGIGVTAAESRLDAAQVVDQIQAVRQAGCPGFALFDLDTTLRQEILPVLRLGVTAP